MVQTKKRKMSLKDFTRCNPGTSRSNTRSNTRKSTNKCLPLTIYSDISKKLKIKDNKSNYNKLFKSVGCQPGEEHCLLDKTPIDENLKKQLRKQYLRPRRPLKWDDDPDMWLNNFNIINCLKQYEQAYSWFKFLGVFPIDFSAPDPYKHTKSPKCLYQETCDLNLKNEYAKGIRGIALIFNLDPHFKDGSHWVALYINLQNIKKPFVGYFDSYGYDVPPLIGRLMRSFKLQIRTCELGYNARKFQFGDSECGMFSMYFIICMMCGISFEDFCKDSVSDDFMLELRKILFAK
jgi:hypothetical protein